MASTSNFPLEVNAEFERIEISLFCKKVYCNHLHEAVSP